MANANHRTMIGGQAVIEGVMMRGVKSTSLSVRRPDGGITTEVWDSVSIKDRCAFLRLPIIRGVVNFVEMLVYGYKTLMKSADLAEPKEEENAGAEQEDEKPSGGEKKDKSSGAVEGVSMLLGIAVAILLFVVLPTFVVTRLSLVVHLGAFKTLVEGILRILIFLGYLVAVSRMKDIQRVFEYHGAEHKTIHCYEHGDGLTPENAKKYRRFHPRCGTSFLLIVLIVGILVYSFVTWNNMAERIVLHILLLPLVVGVSYEIIKFAGRHDNSVLRVLLAPGLWLQGLTTREPDESQLEVAISALQAVLTENREDDTW